MKNQKKEKFIRIQTNGWFLFRHARKGEFQDKKKKLGYFWYQKVIIKLLFEHMAW